MDEANFEDDGLVTATFFQIRAYDGEEKQDYLDSICATEGQAAQRAKTIIQRLRRRDFPRDDEVHVQVTQFTISADSPNALAARAMWIGVALHGNGALGPGNDPPMALAATADTAACQAEIDALFKARRLLKAGR
jgi:hypothetical protein